MKNNPPKVAYFSMEFALKPEIPNFAGGLGVLATDILASAADMELPVVGMSLIYHENDDPKVAFNPAEHFEKLPNTIIIEIEGRQVKVGVWKHEFVGHTGHKVPLYFLDTFFPENPRWDRDLTRELYDTNQYTRLSQEAILGIGGLRMLRELGYDDIDIFHMNEGHASFLTLERLKEEGGNLEKVKESCVFTTHTPIPAGHDRFPYKLAYQVLGSMLPDNIQKLASKEELHTTRLALKTSKKVNGVSKKHAQVCKKMFPEYNFLGITNGVHHLTWISEAVAQLFDKYLIRWREDPMALKNATKIPDKDIREAHRENKKILAEYINSHPRYLIHSLDYLEEGEYFDEDTLTIAFSRRFVPYKRPLLLFSDIDRLRDIGYHKIQIIYSGRCHPSDQYCNNILGELCKLQRQMRGQIRIAVFPNRNLDSARLLVAGSDIWLNNPEPPMEACGTSGMKAAMNGCINLSGLDGWWLEALEMDPKSGWGFGSDVRGHDALDSDSLYQVLKQVISTYYESPKEWVERMKRSMALGGYFNTHRNVQDYLEKMWQD